jgi:hypothetical protein
MKVELDSVSAALGIKTRLQPGQADLLFIEILRVHTPAANYLPASGRRYFQFERIRRYAQAACTVLGTTALVAGAWNGLSLLDTRLQTRDVGNSLDTVIAGVHTHSEPLQMRQVVSAWQALVANRTEPRDILALLSRAVEQQPRLQIDAIGWAPLTAVTPATDSAAEEGSDTPADADAAVDTDMEASVAGGIRITVRGRIEPFDRNYPLAFAEVEHFTGSLRADPRVRSVRVRQQPLDIRPGSTLTGEISPESRDGEAGFAIDIIMSTGNDAA